MPKAQPKYRVSLQLGNKVYTKIAPTVVEALDKMKPDCISKAKAVFTLTVDGLKAQVMLFPVQAKRIFTNKTAKELFQKRLIGALK